MYQCLRRRQWQLCLYQCLHLDPERFSMQELPSLIDN